MRIQYVVHKPSKPDLAACESILQLQPADNKNGSHATRTLDNRVAELVGLGLDGLNTDY